MIKATATGRVTKDAVVFNYSGGSKSGVSFTLASNRDFSGEGEPVFIDCVVFNRDENLAKYITMGNQMIVSGDLDIQITEKGRYTKIIVNDLEFGAKKR